MTIENFSKKDQKGRPSMTSIILSKNSGLTQNAQHLEVRAFEAFGSTEKQLSGKKSTLLWCLKFTTVEGKHHLKVLAYGRGACIVY